MTQESVASQKLREYSFKRKRLAASGTCKMSDTIRQTGDPNPHSISLEQAKQKPDGEVIEMLRSRGSDCIPFCGV